MAQRLDDDLVEQLVGGIKTVCLPSIGAEARFDRLDSYLKQMDEGDTSS